MNIEIETITFYRIAYIRQIGPYGQNNVQTMEKLKIWANSNSLLDEQSIILGIAQDNPELVDPETCRYDACLVIPDNYCINEDSISDGYPISSIALSKKILPSKCSISWQKHFAISSSPIIRTSSPFSFNAWTVTF